MEKAQGQHTRNKEKGEMGKKENQKVKKGKTVENEANHGKEKNVKKEENKKEKTRRRKNNNKARQKEEEKRTKKGNGV